jgi:hypothetical protein
LAVGRVAISSERLTVGRAVNTNEKVAKSPEERRDITYS